MWTAHVVGTGISFWNAEGAVFILTEVVTVWAVWFSTVLRWACLVGWMTLRSIRSVAELFICGALWVGAAAHVVGTGISFWNTEGAVFILTEVVTLWAVWFSTPMVL